MEQQEQLQRLKEILTKITTQEDEAFREYITAQEASYERFKGDTGVDIPALRARWNRLERFKHRAETEIQIILEYQQEELEQ